MTGFYIRLLLVVALFLLPACSDDSGPAPDVGRPDSAVDGGQDLGPDQQSADATVDAPAIEGGVDQGPGPEAGSDSSADAMVDAPGSDAIPDVFPSNAAIFGMVSLKNGYGLDGRGTLYVGLYAAMVPPPFFPPLDTMSIANVDFSQGGVKVPYAFVARPSEGAYLLYAFLDDNSNAGGIFVTPDNGDTAMLAPAPIEVTNDNTDPIEQNLELDLVFGGPPPAPDAGIGDAFVIGALKGRVSATAKPVGDGVGTIWVRISDQPPPSAALGIVAAAGDLASPYDVSHYFMGSLAPGSYYLEVLLDDNGNADPFNPVADAGDLVHTGSIPVRIEPGVTTELDVVLDAVKQ